MSDLVVSVIRTVVPTAVGSVLLWLVAAGVDLDPATAGVDVSDAQVAALTTVGIAACTAGYYAAVRAAERRWPSAGWLLGVAKEPTYAPSAGEDELR